MKSDEFFERGQAFIAEHWPFVFLAAGVFLLLGAILNWNWLCDQKGTRSAYSIFGRTGRRIAVYSLDGLCLIQKFRFSKVDGSQDDNFCFSPDGERFYNIERHGTSYNTAISIYRTSDFSLEQRLLEADPKTEVCTIEFDPASNDCYLLGFFRDEKNSASEYFVARLCDKELKDFKYISAEVFDF